MTPNGKYGISYVWPALSAILEFSPITTTTTKPDEKNSLPCHLRVTLAKTHAIWPGYKFTGRLVLRLLAKGTIGESSSSSVFTTISFFLQKRGTRYNAQENDTGRRQSPRFFLFLLTGRPGPVCLIYFDFFFFEWRRADGSATHLQNLLLKSCLFPVVGQVVVVVGTRSRASSRRCCCRR